MNKKITLYELLGLVKDGKAPKKIKYDNEEYKITKILMENNEYYYNYICNDIECLFPINTNCLNDYVEILDDEDMEIEDVKLIELSSNGILNDTYTDERHYLTANLKDKDIYVRKINQLIRNQQILVREINKLKKEGK